jgi:hypothetical protein
MAAIRVDVIAPLPEGWGLCVTCEAFMAQADLQRRPVDRSLEAFPPDWQENFMLLSDLVERISKKFGERVLIRLYDPRSVQGMAKSLRHGIRRYPAFLIEGKTRIFGLDPAQLEQAIQETRPRVESA